MRERGSTLCHRGLPLLLLILACGLSPARAGIHRYIFVEEPIARFSPATGDSDLFGYAVTLHRVDNTGDPYDFDHAIRNTKIVVGAPSGTYPGGLPRFTGVDDSESLNGTGLVYTCPIVPAECESLSGNGMEDDIRMFDYEENEIMVNVLNPDGIQVEEKEGQFMGATLVSSGEHFMACAPRWISFPPGITGDFDRTRGHGRCFSSGRNLTNFQELRPCTTGRASSEGGEAYCMAGTSAALYEPESSTGTSFFLGGPPYFSSYGAVFVTEDPTLDFTTIEHGTEFLYGGFSIVLGRIFSTDGRDLISSLPKKNAYKGSVRVFDIVTLQSQVEMLGEQMGEYFGWVVATADLNGDGYDEIIVGAPLFSTPDKIEKGRILIYRNNINGSLDTENPIVILGTANKGRFGSAIANLGDINSDGFEDIVVSAPFEEETPANGAEGAVYIFLGSGDSYIIQPYEERISAFQISELLGLDASNYLQSFGYSLSSGVDVDANFNNDLVIGGYKQQAVIVLRTHSIANISLSLATNPQEQLEYNNPNCSVGSDMFACFDLEISASFSGRGLENRSLDVVVDVTENPVMLGARLFFLDSERNRVDSFKGTLNFTTTEDPVQKTITVYVENDISDRRTPLSVVVSVSSLPREPRSVNGSQDIIDLRDIPLLNVLPQNNLEIELTLAGCADPMLCRPDLELTLNETRYLDMRTMNGFDIVVGEAEYVEVALNYQTLTDDAINSFIIVELPPSIFSAPENSTCVFEREGAYKCLLEEIFSDYEGEFLITLRLPLSPDLVGDEEDDIITFTIFNEDRTDPNSANDVVNVPARISAENDITIQSLTVEPNTTQYGDTDRFGTRITARVIFFGAGPSVIPSSELIIYLPGQNDRTGQFYFLYPTSVTGGLQCSGLNPEDLEEFRDIQQLRRRRKRSTPSSLERLQRMITGSGDEHKEHKLQKRAEPQVVNCATNLELCIAINCSIADFGGGSLTVTVTSVIDNRFFESQSDDFDFYAYAVFRVKSDFFEPSEDKTKTSNKFTLQAIPESVDDSIPIWVYIVSALGGLIILVLIIIALILLVVCLRRRTKKKIRRATERRRSRHGTTTASTAPGAVVTSLDTKPDEKPVLEGSLEKPPLDDPTVEPATGDDVPDDVPDEGPDDETEL